MDHNMACKESAVYVEASLFWDFQQLILLYRMFHRWRTARYFGTQSSLFCLRIFILWQLLDQPQLRRMVKTFSWFFLTDQRCQTSHIERVHIDGYGDPHIHHWIIGRFGERSCCDFVGGKEEKGFVRLRQWDEPLAWSPSTHHHFSKRTREGIKTMTMLAARQFPSQAVPNEVLFIIFEYYTCEEAERRTNWNNVNNKLEYVKTWAVLSELIIRYFYWSNGLMELPWSI